MRALFSILRGVSLNCVTLTSASKERIERLIGVWYNRLNI